MNAHELSERIRAMREKTAAPGRAAILKGLGLAGLAGGSGAGGYVAGHRVGKMRDAETPYGDQHMTLAYRKGQVDVVNALRQRMLAKGTTKEAAADDNGSWLGRQRAVARAVRAEGSTGLKKLLADPELIKSRGREGLSTGAKGAAGGVPVGALVGAALSPKGARLAGAGLGALNFSLAGAALGNLAGQSRADKKWLKERGITQRYGGLEFDLSPEAKAKYLHKKAGAESPRERLSQAYNAFEDNFEQTHAKFQRQRSQLDKTRADYPSRLAALQREFNAKGVTAGDVLDRESDRYSHDIGKGGRRSEALRSAGIGAGLGGLLGETLNGVKSGPRPHGRGAAIGGVIGAAGLGTLSAINHRAGAKRHAARLDKEAGVRSDIVEAEMLVELQKIAKTDDRKSAAAGAILGNTLHGAAPLGAALGAKDGHKMRAAAGALSGSVAAELAAELAARRLGHGRLASGILGRVAGFPGAGAGAYLAHGD